MTVAKLISTALCAASFFSTLLCMLLSAAGLRAETRSVFGLTVLLLLIGFTAGAYSKSQLQALRRAKAAPIADRAMMNEAIAALQTLEQHETPENRAAFLQKAVPAVMSLGNIRATRREHAVVAAAVAIAQQHALRRACESNDDTTALQKEADAGREAAVRAIWELL